MYRDILHRNIEIAANLDQARYPELKRWFRNSSALRCYSSLIQTIAGYEKPLHTSKSGKAYYAVSVSWLIAHYGGAAHVWQSSLILLQICGMIERIVPSRSSTNHAFKSLYQTAKRSKRRSESVYHVPELTESVLNAAECIICRWRQSGVSMSHVTKSSVIRVFGQDYADRIYLDGRTEPFRKKEIKEIMYQIITAATHGGGCITKAAVFIETFKELSSKLAIQDVWQRLHKVIISECGCKYSRPTAAEKQKYNLKNDQWIIRRDEE